ncbi:CHAP domain-containing protein [Streptomyces halstedii]|uniref:CHAP domain-containing protein n=1 Tax=Streptomyces halstedii TaxID=1944 RepID=UPI00335D61B6
MGTAKGMVRAAEKTLGMSGRPNVITRAYASRHGEDFLRAAWCQMGVTYWARKSDNAGAVLPKGDRAYTVWAAEDFKKIDRWFSGTTDNVDAARLGDVVWFDWNGANGTGPVDHVGIVVRALGGGRVETIEANTGDAVKRRVRASNVIACIGRPAYSGSSSGEPSTGMEGDDPLIGLKIGDEGQAVKALQELCRAAGFAKNIDKSGGSDGKYGDGTAEDLRLVRKSVGSKAGPEYGNQVDGWAYAQLHIAVARKQGGTP